MVREKERHTGRVRRRQIEIKREKKKVSFGWKTHAPLYFCYHIYLHEV